MQEGWELIADTGRGWCTISRQYGPTAYASFEQWRMSNPTYKYPVRLRKVTELDPPLSYENTPDGSEEEMPDRNTTAKDEALVFASRLAQMLRNPDSVDTAILFGVARKFAKFEGYSDADGAFAYIEGFVQGFGTSRNTSHPQVTGPTIDETN